MEAHVKPVKVALTRHLWAQILARLVMKTQYPQPAVRLRVLVYAKRDTTKLERIVLAVIMDCTRRASAMPLLARNAYWGTRYSQPPLPSTIVIAARARISLCRIHSNVTFVHRMHTPIPRILIPF